MMRRSLALLALVALLFFAAGAQAEVVDTLTADSFDDYISSHKYVVVEFYAPWCGHCKHLAPEYEAAAEILKSEDIHLAKVDATVEADLASRFEIRGYPTLKMFVEGEISEYKGGRVKNEIVTYLRKKFGPAVAELANAEALEKAKKDNQVIVVAFLEKASGAAFEAFERHAKTDDKISYFYTTDAAVAAAEEVSVPGIALFKQFDEGKNVFEGDASKTTEIASFVSGNSVPLVIPFDMSVVQTIFSSPQEKVAFLFRTEDEAEELDAAFHALAKEFRDLAVFATSDWSESRLNQYVSVAPDNGPVFTLLNTPRGSQIQKFPLEGKLTPESMKAHLEGFKTGTIKPFFKSAPVPADNDGPVTVIVGKNFDEVVLDSDRDVLLEVYAPWCGHCKKLAPTWEELGEHFAKDSNIVVAKMDGTENEVDGLVANGYPTIKFYPAGSKTAGSGSSYNGGRDLDSLIQFLESSRKSSPSKEAAADTHDDL